MKTISSMKNKLVIEMDAQDRRLIGCLFSIISTDTGNPVPWWATEDGTGATVMDNEVFDDLWQRWNALTDAPEAKAFFASDDV